MPHDKPFRIAIPSTIDDAPLRRMPAGVEIVRYQVDNPQPDEVDMLVPLGWPSPGYEAKKLIGSVRTRYIQTMSAGVEAILSLVPPGVTLCNARGVHDSPTAEWTVTAILASLKWFPFYGTLRREARWGGRSETDAQWEQVHGNPFNRQAPVAVEELAGKTVMIVGYGSIGKAIEARLKAFEPERIVRVARTAREGIHPTAELPQLLPEADVVVLITPLTPETHHLIGAKELNLMRRGAVLVNAARGSVIDTDALVAALETGQVRAALDVTDPEPLPEGHPLWKAPNLLLTPHVAGATPALLDRVFRFVAEQAKRMLAGEQPMNVISGTY